MGTVRGIRCELAYGENRDFRCVWCGSPLTGRQVTWCSPECSEAFRANHCWTNARQAALERDAYTCRRCTLPPLHRPKPREFGWDRRAYDFALATFEDERLRRNLEVNHVMPRLGAGYGPGCWHHLEPAWASDLLLSVEIGGQGEDPHFIITEHPRRPIAGGAQDPADAPSDVIVVYVRADFREAALADGTRVPLRVEHRSVGAGLKAVVHAEVGGLGGTPLGAVDRVGSRDPLAAAQKAGNRLLAHSATVAELASLGAVQGPSGSPRERCGALQAAVGDGSALEGASTAETGVVTFADSGPLPRGMAGAVNDGAAWERHAEIIRVMASAMPGPNGGLEVLCHDHHVGETTFQRRERVKPEPELQLTLLAS